MKKIIVMPRRYVQGPGVLSELGAIVAPVGKRAIVFWDSFIEGAMGSKVLGSLAESGIESQAVLFGGEATQAQRKSLVQAARDFNAAMIIALGGGKTLDTAKGAAADCKIAMICCPTIASTDSPTSGCAVWYKENGDYEGWEMMTYNPDFVIVDSEVIVNAPIKTFIAGMGDALSTWIEADVVRKSRSKNFVGGYNTEAALVWAQLCFDILMEFGRDARRDVERHLITPAVEKVIEADVLLSGIGFESVGLACSHDIGNFLSNYHECHAAGLMHGHKVAFGVLTQLCLDENVDPEFRESVLDFIVDIGLPCTFEQLGFKDLSEAQLREKLTPMAEFCAAEGSLSSSHSFPLTPKAIIDAMFAADAMGRERIG